MTDHACSEMYVLMKRLADTYQRILDHHGDPTQVERGSDAISTTLFDVRQEMREHQKECLQCRRTMHRISMQTSGRERVA